MAYHEAFWATIGAVAPVIGLAQAVLVGRNDQRVERLAAVRRRQMTEIQVDRTSTAGRIAELEQDLREQQSLIDAAERDDVEARESIIAQALARNAREDVAQLHSQIAEAKVAYEKTLSRAAQFDGLRQVARGAVWISVTADIVALAGWLFCGFALLLSLLSLSSESAVAPRWVAVVLVAVPMFGLVSPQLSDRPMRSRLKKLGLEE